MSKEWSRNNVDSVLSRYLVEFCAPVVLTCTTAEVDKACLRNGLLLHELLGGFARLDNTNSVVRTGSGELHIQDAQIRFEALTEARVKNGFTVDAHLSKIFKEADLTQLPSSLQSVQNSNFSGWSRIVENSVMRSMAFHECESMSQPLILMTVVSTADVDPVAAMQELASSHHVPANMRNGQYDPNVTRVYVLLHDATAEMARGASSFGSIMQALKSRFPVEHLKTLVVNSLGANSLNTQQPDIWTTYIPPRWYPEDIHVLKSPEGRKAGAQSDESVLGKHLSMEDFVGCRNFCMELYNDEIIPSLERRLFYLNKQVAESRKGMKNFLKGFLRKPREEGTKGSIRYPFDRIESQTMLLADTLFALGDYEGAAGHYRLVRDDFRADRSHLHVLYCSFMLALGHCMTDPNRPADRKEHMDSIVQVISLPFMTLSNSESFDPPMQSSAFFSLLGAEIFTSPRKQSCRNPREAAYLLQHAASLTQKGAPLMCALLTERAAKCFLSSGLMRRFAFHEVIAGQKFSHAKMLENGRVHSTNCFAKALLLYDEGNWGGLRARLVRGLMNDIMFRGDDGARRAFMLMIVALERCLKGRTRALSSYAYDDALLILEYIMAPGRWGRMHVVSTEQHGGAPTWASSNTREILQGPLPLQEPCSAPENTCIVEGLSLPEVDQAGISLLVPVNGMSSFRPFMEVPEKQSEAYLQHKSMRNMLQTEKLWIQNRNKTAASTVSEEDYIDEARHLGRCFAEAEVEILREARRDSHRGVAQNVVRVPLGENVVMRVPLRNKLPVPLALSQLHLEFTGDDAAKFAVESTSLNIDQKSVSDAIISAKPSQLGSFEVPWVCWRIGQSLVVKQRLLKPGCLLHATQEQRSRRLRGAPTPMTFQVTAPHPLLALKLHGLPKSALEGELLWCVLELSNLGELDACGIELKTSRPFCVWYTTDVKPTLSHSSEKYDHLRLPIQGQSGTVTLLPTTTIIPAKGSIKLGAFIRFPRAISNQRISFLTTYSGYSSTGEAIPFGPDKRCRSSFLTETVTVCPSVTLSTDSVGRISDCQLKTLVVDVRNNLTAEPAAGESLSSRSVSIEEIVGFGSFTPLRSESEEKITRIAAPQESLSFCLPVSLNDHTDSGIHSLLVSQAKEASMVASVEVTTVACILSGILRANMALERATSSARVMLEAEEKSAKRSGPRSIAQVRRENRALAAEMSAPSVEDHLFDESFDDVDRGSIVATQSPRAMSVEIDNPLAFQSYVDTPQNIAESEAARQTVALVVAWSVQQNNGDARSGIAWMQGTSLLSKTEQASPAAPVEAPPSSALTHLAEKLVWGIQHAPTVSLNGRRVTTVPLQLTLRSVGNVRVYVTVRCMDEKIDESLSWVGQTRYVDIRLEPGQSRQVPFKVRVRSGIHNLNQFSVSVSTKKGDGTHNSAFIRNVAQESFLKVG